MDYYQCPNEKLREEISRRGYTPIGSQDHLSEGLKKDDDSRGTDATTIETLFTSSALAAPNRMREVEFGKTMHPELLVGERIVHWTMNTFFPTIHLFFESGLSSIIDGGELPDAVIGLDPNLRFRLTDINYEEDGRLVKSTLPEKFVGPSPSIRILEAKVARRTSVGIKYVRQKDAFSLPSAHPQATIAHEGHMVVGLRLEGMKELAYVWARIPTATVTIGQRTWGDVRFGGLRDDVPAPFFGFPVQVKPGDGVTVVSKVSLVGGYKKPGA